MSSNVTAITPSVDRPWFFDDSSDPTLARYYEITPGIGHIVRRADGLHYLRGPSTVLQAHHESAEEPQVKSPPPS